MNERYHQDRRRKTDGSKKPEIAVVIPVYNGGMPFHRCLKSVINADPSPAAVVVVADGDTDGSRVVAEQFGARVMTHIEPGGPAVARNAGTRAVRKDDIIFFVDADVAIKSGTVGEMAAVFKGDPTVGAVIGSYDDAPTAMNFHSQFKNLFHHYVHQTAREDASTFWGACGAVKHEVFRAIGGFDERYRHPSIEDIELGYRLKRAGYRIRLSKHIQVTHMKQWRLWSMLKADVLYRALPWTELIHRDRQLINDLNLSYSGRLSGLLVPGVLFTVFAGVWMPQLLGVAGGLTLVLLGLNASVYRFFHRKRGLMFTLRVIPWHWLYFLYSGLAFAIGTARYFASRSSRPVVKSAHRQDGRDKTPPSTEVRV
ncbi:MAG: glycosyltransferase [Nitrospiraceae bacterium]